jgi:hypothetical protein
MPPGISFADCFQSLAEVGVLFMNFVLASLNVLCLIFGQGLNVTHVSLEINSYDCGLVDALGFKSMIAKYVRTDSTL